MPDIPRRRENSSRPPKNSGAKQIRICRNFGVFKEESRPAADGVLPPQEQRKWGLVPSTQTQYRGNPKRQSGVGKLIIPRLLTFEISLREELPSTVVGLLIFAALPDSESSFERK